MRTRQQIVMGIVVGLGVCWLGQGLLAPGIAWAQLRPVPAKPLQYAPSTQEPPLAGVPQPPQPPPPPVPPPSPKGLLPPAFTTPQPILTTPPSAIVAPPPIQGDVCPVLDPPTPSVSLRVRVTACALPQQEIEYHLLVKNESAAPAHHVLVRNPIPCNARLVRATPEPNQVSPEIRWHLGTLEPGSCREIVLVMLPTGCDDVKNCARVQFEHGQCVTTRVVRSGPQLVAPQGMVPQAVVPQTIVPQVIPPQGIPPQVVVPQVSPPQGVTPQPLPNGEKPLQVAPLPPDTKKDQEPPLSVPPNGKKDKEPPLLPPPNGSKDKEPPSITEEGAKAKLTLTMDGPKSQYANLPARYRITVRNVGKVPATNLLVASQLPAGATYLSSDHAGAMQKNQVAWLLGNLAPNDSRTVEVVLRANQQGEFCIRGMARADGNVTAAEEFCTKFQGVSALSLELVDRDDPIQVGGKTSYTITVVNQGSAPVTNLRIKAFIPPQLQLTLANGASPPPLPKKLLPAGPDGVTLQYEALPTLAPGAKAIYEIFVNALAPGDVRFRVEMTADQLKEGGAVREEESTHILPATPPGPPQVKEAKRTKISR